MRDEERGRHAHDRGLPVRPRQVDERRVELGRAEEQHERLDALQRRVRGAAGDVDRDAERLQVDVAIEPAALGRSRLVVGELDLDREHIGLDAIDLARACRLAHIVERRLERLEPRRVSRTITRAASVRSDRLLAVFAFRTSPTTSDATVSTSGAAFAAASRSGLASGHAARCTDPSCHHDHTSSVTKGRCGAKSRRSTSSARASAACAEAWPVSPRAPYARCLTSST